MKVTLMDWHETFRAAWDAEIDRLGGGEGNYGDAVEIAAWSAVIEKHIGPMIREAYCAGWLDVDGHGPSDEGKEYAARIISDLTAPGSGT